MHNVVLLKYTKDRRIERMGEEQERNSPNITYLRKHFFSLLLIKRCSS